MFEVRVLSPDDWELWRELRLRALAEAPYAFSSTLADWQGDGDSADRWRGRLGISGSYNVVVALDGQPVGMASGVPGEVDAVVELISMWVAPEARGRGVGDELLQAIASWARGVGARELRLAVVADNPAAVGVYQRNGFHLTGEFGDLMADGVRCELIMAREL